MPDEPDFADTAPSPWQIVGEIKAELVRVESLRRDLGSSVRRAKELLGNLELIALGQERQSPLMAVQVEEANDGTINLLLDILRVMAKESNKGYVREEQLVAEAGRRGVSPSEALDALTTLRRKNLAYARGGSGTYAPLNP